MTWQFEQWANSVWNFGAGLGAEVSLKNFRKDMIIEFYNEAGQLAIAYKVYRCWVSEYQAQPDLDANANAVAIQHIKLENEGWERDMEVQEPTEPSFTVPAGLNGHEGTLSFRNDNGMGARRRATSGGSRAYAARSLLRRAEGPSRARQHRPA